MGTLAILFTGLLVAFGALAFYGFFLRRKAIKEGRMPQQEDEENE